MRTPDRIVRRSGVRWQLRHWDQHGRLRWKTFRTRADAEKFGREAASNVESGIGPSLDMRLNELVAEFRRARLGSDGGLRPSSIKDAEAALARIEDHFGRRKLTSIHPPDIERFRDGALTELRAERDVAFTARLDRKRLQVSAATRKDHRARLTAELSRLEAEAPTIRADIAVVGVRTINKVIASLRTIFKFAIGRRYLNYNAAAHVRMLKKVVDDNRPVDHACLTPAEIARLIAATDPDWRAAIMVAAYGGLRLGELLGLGWADVELSANRLLVRRQLEAVTGELRAPKTKAGSRFVELPGFVMLELKKWKLRCPKGEPELVFPDSAGRPMDDRNLRSRVFYPALRRAGLRRIRVHDLRHTGASLMIATGADLAAISRQLGHANPQITLSTYAHAFARRSESGLGAKMEALVAAEVRG